MWDWRIWFPRAIAGRTQNYHQYPKCLTKKQKEEDGTQQTAGTHRMSMNGGRGIKGIYSSTSNSNQITKQSIPRITLHKFQSSKKRRNRIQYSQPESQARWIPNQLMWNGMLMIKSGNEMVFYPEIVEMQRLTF